MADTSPKDAQNGVDGNEQNKVEPKKESSAKLLQKSIASRVQEFLETTSGKTALDRGKEYFMEQFFLFVDKEDGDLLTAFKALQGKKPDDELTLDDIADIKITYEDTYETYIESASRERFDEQQTQAVAQAFLAKMDSVIASKDFSDELRQLYEKYITPHKKSVRDVSEMQRLLKEFFKNAGGSLSDKQKKRLTKVSVGYRDVSEELVRNGHLEKAVADKLQQKKIISANTDAEQSVKSFLHTYAKSELLPAYASTQTVIKEITAIYKVPGFDTALSGYDLSVKNLLAHDEAFAKISRDPDASDEKKKLAQQAAMVALISKKDKAFGELVKELFAHDFNLARVPLAEQQLYLDRFLTNRSETAEMKLFKEFSTKIGLNAEDSAQLYTQLFDLSRNDIQITSKDGKTYAIPLQKKIIDRPWVSDNASEQLAHAIPVVFLLKAGEHLDEAYLQRFTNTEKKSFSLRAADGKELTIFPGHHVELTDAKGNKKAGYIYRDPEGNITLSPQPGSKEKVTISAADMAAHSARIVEPTYAVQADQTPALLTHLAMMAESRPMSDEQIHEAIQDRNDDIADQTLNENFSPAPVSVQDQEIESADRDNPAVLAAVAPENKQALQDHLDKRLTDFTTRQTVIDKELKAVDKRIEDLSKKIAAVKEKQPFNQKEFDKLTTQALKANDQKNALLDEKKEIERKKDIYENAQQKVVDSLPPVPAPSVQEGRDDNEKFLRAWTDLSGDKTLTEPIPGKTCLMVSLPDATSSLTGGGAAWVRGDVVGYNSDTQTMQIEWHGVEGPLKSKEGSRSTIEGEEGIQELKRSLGKVYKFKKYGSVAERGIDLKGGVSTSDESEGEDRFHFDKKYEGRWKHVKDDINFSSMKHQRTGKDIKYFGKKSGAQRARYEVETHGGSITVKQMSLENDPVTGKSLSVSYERKMPVNDFMMFAMEKDLRGYTQEEVDVANGGDKDTSRADIPYIADWVEHSPQESTRFGSGLLNLRWGSIAGILSFWETTKKGIKSHFDDKASKTKTKTENALLGASRFKAMEKIPILGGAVEDVRIGLDNKLDNEKKKKINEYKDEIDQKKDSSSNGASDFIKNALSEKEAHLYPEKAAGYYFHALEKGGNPYFRSLREFEGTGYRVGMILGRNYKDKYLAYIKNIKQELIKNPTSGELKNDLAKGELGFMQKLFNEGGDTVQGELKRLLGNWFFTGGLGAAEYTMRYNGSKIDETYKNEGAKPFHQLYKDSRTGWYEGFRVNDVLGGLKLMSEKVGASEEYYYNWSGAMLLPLINGQYREYMIGSYQGIFQQLARKNAFPFAAYISEGNGTEKIQQLFDIFSNGSLSEALKGKTTIIDRTKAFKGWREANGRATLDQLQSPKQLFEKKKELAKNLKDQDALNQYNTLSDYITHKYNDEDRSNISEEVDGESIIYQKNILSSPSGFVAAQMLNFANGQFKGRSEKHGPDLWLALKSKLSDIQNIPREDMSEDFFIFLLKRYFTIFQTRYSGTAKRRFVAALKYPNIPDIFKLNVRGIFDKKFGGDDLPGEMEDTLIIFEKIFKQYAPLIQENPSMLEGVFDDPRMAEYYTNATENDIMSEANSMKQQQAEIKKRIQSGQFDYEDSYM